VCVDTMMVYVEVLFFMGFSQIKYRLIDPVARYIIHSIASISRILFRNSIKTKVRYLQ